MAEFTDIKKLLVRIENGDLPLCALIFGEETFYIDKLIEKLELFARKKSLEFFRTSANEIKLNELLELVNQNSLFSSGQIIIVKEFGKLIKSSPTREEEDNSEEIQSQNSIGKGLLELFIDYLEKPNPATFLFLTHPDRIDMRLKFYKTASHLIPFYQSKKIYEKEIFEFIEQKFLEKKIKVNLDILEYVYKTVGNNLYDIDAELDRLFISIAGQNKVDVENIKKYLIPVRKFSIFDLMNAFRDKNIKSALEIGLNLISNNSSLVYIITMLQKYFFSLLTYNEIRNQYKSDEKVAAIIGCHPYFLKDYELASKRYRFEELERIFDILLKTDIELKSLNLKEEVLFTSLVSEIGLALKKL